MKEMQEVPLLFQKCHNFRGKISSITVSINYTFASTVTVIAINPLCKCCLLFGRALVFFETVTNGARTGSFQTCDFLFLHTSKSVVPEVIGDTA